MARPDIRDMPGLCKRVGCQWIALMLRSGVWVTAKHQVLTVYRLRLR